MHISQLEAGLGEVRDLRASQQLQQERLRQRVEAYSTARLILGGFFEIDECSETMEILKVHRDKLLRIEHESASPAASIVFNKEVRGIPQSDPTQPPFQAALQAQELWVGRKISSSNFMSHRLGSSSRRFVNFLKLPELHNFRVEFAGPVNGEYEPIGRAVEAGITEGAARRLRNGLGANPSYELTPADITGNPIALEATARQYFGRSNPVC
jgi:hypothetical protein